MVVDQSARGKGIGKALMNHALEKAVKFGLKSVDLTSRPSREEANMLYQSLGYQKRETNVYRYNFFLILSIVPNNSIITTMKSADFFFSFLLFFQVQIESIKESGFYKMFVEKYPEMAENISDPKHLEPEFQEIINLTGLNFDDFTQFSFTVEGLDSISKASQQGRSPKLGSELDFHLSAKVKDKIDANKMFSAILDKTLRIDGEDWRKKVERTISKRGKTSSIIIPHELLDENILDDDLKISILSDGNYSQIELGLSEKTEITDSAEDINSSLSCIKAMSKDRDITLGFKIDPTVWERPEFNTQQQNPLFAGLANSVKGIREIGFSSKFLANSIALELCVHCRDTQAALGLWTVAQGAIGMAQISINQQGSQQVPEIINRIKTEAFENNVFIRVDVFLSDLEQLL